MRDVEALKSRNVYFYKTRNKTCLLLKIILNSREFLKRILEFTIETIDKSINFSSISTIVQKTFSDLGAYLRAP